MNKNFEKTRHDLLAQIKRLAQNSDDKKPADEPVCEPASQNGHLLVPAILAGAVLVCGLVAVAAVKAQTHQEGLFNTFISGHNHQVQIYNQETSSGINQAY